jgi:hypothetical protein
VSLHGESTPYMLAARYGSFAASESAPSGEGRSVAMIEPCILLKHKLGDWLGSISSDASQYAFRQPWVTRNPSPTMHRSSVDCTHFRQPFYRHHNAGKRADACELVDQPAPPLAEKVKQGHNRGIQRSEDIWRVSGERNRGGIRRKGQGVRGLRLRRPLLF